MTSSSGEELKVCDIGCEIRDVEVPGNNPTIVIVNESFLKTP